MDNSSLKITMVIPSYWSRDSSVGWKEGDAFYDHPTPLDGEGTLARAIESIDVLKDKDFQLVVIAVATTQDIEQQVEKKVSDIIKSASLDVEVFLFGSSHLRRIHDLLIRPFKRWMFRYVEVNNLSTRKFHERICRGHEIQSYAAQRSHTTILPRPGSSKSCARLGNLRVQNAF